jgi:ubiquinone/menaquinone biosynthesis C-methylase UbiE
MTTDPNGINDRERFDEWSKTYERSWMQGVLFDRVHRRLLASLPEPFSPESILDIGCGTGRLLRRLGARWPGAQLVGVDLAEGMVAQARAQTPGAAIEVGRAEALPLPDASVDLVTSTVSFHHWTDQARGIREAARVLRPGGLFALADMSLPVHSHPTTRRMVRAMFAAAGLALQSQHSPVLFFTFTIGEKDSG